MSYDISEFDREYKEFWEQPDEFVLVKDKDPERSVPSIFRLNPQLMFVILENFEDAKKVISRMLEQDVKVFDDMKDLLEWYGARNK